MKRIITLSIATMLLASGASAGAVNVQCSQANAETAQAAKVIVQKCGNAEAVWKQLCEKYGVPYQPLCGNEGNTGGSCGQPCTPDVTPENPDVTPEDPDVTPENPDVTPENPDVTPEDPDVTPEDPDVTPEDPDVTPENPDVTPENPDVTPEDPDVTPENPDVKPENPDVTPETPGEEQGNTDTSLSGYAAEVVKLVNAERAKQGLAALKEDATVSSAAQVRATEIRSTFSHTRPNGSSCFTALKEAGVSYRAAGENIAYGQQTPADVMNAWMNSEGHRANIMSSNFTTIGIGYVVVNGTPCWTQFFTA